jgi:hypothetical protein
MPPLIIAVVAVAATYAASAAVTAIAGAALIAAIGATGAALFATAVGSIVGAVVAYAGNALVASSASKPKVAGSAQTAADDAKRTVRGSTEPRRIVYGRARVSGPLIYAGSYGPSLEFLILVIPLCDHAIDGVDAVWIGETRVAASEIAPDGEILAGRFAPDPGAPLPGPLRIRILDGTQTTADAMLVEECPDGWRPEDRLLGIAHLVVRLRYSQDRFPNGIPSISAEVRGKKVFDPRSGFTQYSENWALCVLDYLRSEAGIAAADDEIDLPYFNAAANLSDEAVQIIDDGTTQPRYNLNGTFTLDRKPIDIIEEMLIAGAGALVYVAGKYRLHGGAYEAPALTLDESDLASGVEVVTRPPRRELFNSVRGSYVEPNALWQAYPFWPIQSGFAADDGEVIWREFEFPWLLDPYRPQRIAYQLMLRARQGVTIRATVKYAQLDLSVWQTVAVSIADFGWVAKPFRIMAWAFSPDTGLITLTMQEEQASSYAWSFDDANAAPDFPDTTLVSPFDTPAPIGLAVTEELYATRDGAGVRTKAVLAWQPPATPFVSGYDIEFKQASEAAWRPAAAVTAPPSEVLDLSAGSWDFRVRVSTLVGKGAWATVRSSIGALAATPPAVVTGLGLQANGGMAYLRWDRSEELDVRVGGRYEIRHSSDPSTPSWVTALSLGEAINGEASSAVLPLKAGTYFIRAVDAGGVYGPVASTAGVKVAAFGYTNLATATEHTGFTGTKTGTVVTSSTLRLDSTGLVDAEASFDAIVDLDALGGFAASGSYDFAATMDLGSAKNARLTSRIVSTVALLTDTWDLRVTPIDEWTAIDAVGGGEADAWVEVRTAPTSPFVWDAWRRLDSGEFNARAFQFRAQLRSYQSAFNIHISELSVTAEEAL